LLICYNVLIRQTITIQWVHPKIVSLEHFSLNWQKLVSQVSISSTFYAHIFCTKACFWHQNFVRMLYFEFKIFGAEFRMKITHKKHWWNWPKVTRESHSPVVYRLDLAENYQGKYFENAIACSKRTLKTTVATQLYIINFWSNEVKI